MSDREMHDDSDQYGEMDRDRGTHDYHENPSEKGKWMSAAIALIGLLLVVQALVFDLDPGNEMNDIIVGIALIALGGYNYYRRGNEKLASTGAAALAALLGLWLIIAPFVYGDAAGGADGTTDIGFWTDIVLGLATLLLGAYSAYESREARRGTPANR